MLRPKIVPPPEGGPHPGIPAGDYLYLDGRTIASPALRVLAWFDSGVDDAALDQGCRAVMDLFLARFGHELRSVTRSRDGHVPKAEMMTPQLLAAARETLTGSQPDKRRRVRMGGWIDAPHFIEAAPYLRLDHAEGLVMLELALPHEAPDLIDITDDLTRIIAAMPLRCGVMGLGFFMPVYLESLIFALPMATAHLLAAIEITLDGPVSVMGPQGRKTADLAPGEGPVLPDIGWRTLLGAPFMPYLPDLAGLDDAADVTVLRERHFVAITAGIKPIWGAMAKGEDIGAYALVARALYPLRMSRRATRDGLFGGSDDDPARAERICAYLARFDV